LFPAVEGGLKPCRAALRKGHRDLPVFFDELNDALEAHNAEEYGRIALMRRSRVTMRRRKQSFIVGASAVSRQLKYPANKYIFL
jgi:hypothetical protein